MIREKGRLSIRDVLKERDLDLWGKLEEVWRKAGPIYEDIERNKDKPSAMPHSIAVEDNLSALIPDDWKREKLQPIELFSLSAAACLHDADKGWGALKRVHGQVSAGEIRAHFAEYGLDPGQADIVGWIIKMHDHGDFIHDLPAEPLAIGAAKVDIKPLAAVFKLADTLHTDYRRVNNMHATEAKERARICIRGWAYDDGGRIRFQAVPEKVSDLVHIHKAIAMMRRDIEPIAPILREAGCPYELTTTQIDEDKLIYPAQEKRRSGRSFIGMDFFDEDDQHLFKGREAEGEELYELLQAGDPIVALVGDSGVGKTSLITAGLFPILRKTGNWKFVYTRPLNDPASDVIREIWLRIAESDPPEDTDLIRTFEHISDENWDSTLLVVMDQFEDIFRTLAGRKQIAEALYPVQAKRFRNLRVLLSYRADAEGKVGPMLQKVAQSLRSLPRMYLEHLDRDGAREALEAGFGAAQIGLDPDVGAEEFMSLILDDIEAQGRGFYPPYVQMVGETLCDKAKDKIVRKSMYDSSGRAGGIIGNYLFNQLDSFGDRRGDAERILVELTSVVSPEGRKARTKSVEDLERDLSISREALEDLLRSMIDKRMIRRSDDGKYEIIHDHLAELVDENLIAAGEEREFRQFRERLAAAAATYTSTGLLLEPVVMAKLYQNRERINPSLTEKAILLHSCLAGNGPAWYWFRDSPRRGYLPLLHSALSRYELRLAAVHALGLAGDRTVISELMETAMYSSGNIERAATDALVRLATQEDISDLIYMLQRGSKYARMVVAEGLVQLNAQQAIPELREMFKDGSISVRMAAAEVLCRLGVRDAVPKLIRMLKDASWDVRKAAAELLSRLHVQEAISELRHMLGDRSKYVRMAAAEALARRGDRGAIPELTSMLNDESERVQMAAEEALARLATWENIAQLKVMLENRSWGMWGIAVDALVQAANPEDIPVLRVMLEDEVCYIRRAAVQALARLNDQQVVPKLREMIRDKNQSVQKAAAYAFAQLITQGKGNVPKLREMLRYWYSSYIRLAAAEALSSLGSEEDISCLLGIFTSERECSEAKNALIGIDRRLYCPFDWPEDNDQ